MALAAWFCAIEVTTIHGKYLKNLSSTFHCRVVNLFMVLLIVFVLSCQKSTTTNTSGPSFPSAPGTTTSGSSGNGGTVTVPPQECGADGGGGDAGISQKISTEKISKILSELPIFYRIFYILLKITITEKKTSFNCFSKKKSIQILKRPPNFLYCYLKKYTLVTLSILSFKK